MTANTQFDFDLKCGLLDDVLTIVDVERVVNNIEEQVGGFDLIYKNGPVRLPSSSTYTTLLGCYNNRISQLKRMGKATATKLKVPATPIVKQAAS
jgi:tubulin polyglutamylase TTLL9